MKKDKVYEPEGLSEGARERLGEIRVSSVVLMLFPATRGGLDALIERHAEGDRGHMPSDEESSALGLDEDGLVKSLYVIGAEIGIYTDPKRGTTSVRLLAEDIV